MGMTIEQDIKVIRKMLAYTDLSVRANLTADMVDACENAISIMRKYQKIVGIVSLNDEEFKQCGLKELKEILEVIADGTINSTDCV